MQIDIEAWLSAPAWRALDVDDDGRVLAASDEHGSMQLVELRPDGSRVELTALPGPCRGRYLPGLRAVVVEHDAGGDERAQLALLTLDTDGWAPAGPGDLEPIVTDPRFVHRLVDVLPGRVVYATNRRDGVDFDVVVRAVPGDAEQVVYDGGGYVGETAVSPDARHVVLTVPGGPAESDQVLMVDTMPIVEAERVVALTEATAPGRHRRLSWLADGRTVLLASDADGEFTEITTVGVDGTRRVLVADPEHDLLGWPSPNGALLLVETNVDGESVLSLHDAATGERLRDVALPAGGTVTFPVPDPVWSPDSRTIAVSFTAPGTPGDVLLIEATTGLARSLTTSAAALPVPGVEPTLHLAPGDAAIPCLVYDTGTIDASVDAAGRSAVLVLHGGPASQSRRHFNPVIQGLAAAGHVVVVPNVRGSTGYGRSWYSADDGRRRLVAVDDLATVHDWLPTLGVDPTRVALWGGSYGGYLVLAGLAFQPDRWAAGVDIVGISSLVTFLENTADHRRAHREREYGSLADDLDFLRDASPLTRVTDIAAPLFVVHGAGDVRVPLSEAEQLVTAVRKRGAQCELLVYPDEGHGLAHRVNRLDAYPRALAFLADHL